VPAHVTDVEGEPKQPWRAAGKIGSGHDPEDEHRNRNVEDETGQGLVSAFPQEPRPSEAIADADQPEDRDDDACNLIHAGKTREGKAATVRP
jgi:hypothetical protein